MTKQEAFRLLADACKKKSECKVGSTIYRFSAYDIRQNQVVIDLLDKTNQVKTIFRELDVIAAFMDRAMTDKLSKEEDKIVQLSDLVPFKPVRESSRTVEKNVAKVWDSKGLPHKIVFSADFSRKIAKQFPSLRVKIYFLGQDIVFVSTTEKKSTRLFTNSGAPGRLGMRCEKFSSHVKHKSYTCIIQDIDGKLSIILTGEKNG